MGWFDIFGGSPVTPPTTATNKAKTTGAPSFEQSVAQDPVLSQVLSGARTMTLVGNREQLALIEQQLTGLGYLGTLQEKLTSFQKFIGITEGLGQLVGQRTLRGLIVADRAGGRWKEAVAGLALTTNVQPANAQTARSLAQSFRRQEVARAIYDTSDGNPNTGRQTRSYQLENTATPAAGGVIDQSELLRAYVLLGVMREGESLVTGNDRFQILSGANRNRDYFGATTYQKLLEALDAVAQGRPWLPPGK
jgi:hypothetical protein